MRAAAPRAARRPAMPVSDLEDQVAPVDPRTEALNRQADALTQSASARLAQAKAWERIADTLERFVPAATMVHSCGARLDALCAWLKSAKPWVIALAGLILVRLVNADPKDLPKVLDGLSALAGLAK